MVWWAWWIGGAVFAGNGAMDGATDGATDGIEQGEYQRLVEEMLMLVDRNAWAGVERTFVAMEALGERLSFRDWLHGAKAARARGDMGAVRARLIAANGIREDREVLEWLWDVDARFAAVRIQCDLGAWWLLESDQAPFDPDLARAIEFAKGEVAQRCDFDGLLPFGTYRIGEAAIAVAPRSPATLDLRGVPLSRTQRRDNRRRWRSAMGRRSR